MRDAVVVIMHSSPERAVLESHSIATATRRARSKIRNRMPLADMRFVIVVISRH